MDAVQDLIVDVIDGYGDSGTIAPQGGGDQPIGDQSCLSSFRSLNRVSNMLVAGHQGLRTLLTRIHQAL